MVADRIIGTLDVHSRTDRFAFGDHHLSLLQMLASQAAIALENARLYQELLVARDVELQRSNQDAGLRVGRIARPQEPLRKVRAFGDHCLKPRSATSSYGEEGRVYIEQDAERRRGGCRRWSLTCWGLFA